MKSQKEDIKNYLRTHSSGITSKEAFDMFGITRLSAIIYVLRDKEKMNIDTVSQTGKNRHGRPTHFACYKLMD